MTSSSGRRPAAIVIGLDSVTGLQTARILAGRRIPVVGIARNPRHPSCRTRVCERIVVATTAGEELADLLERLAPAFADPPVLFPCTDLSVLAVSTYRDRLAAGYRSVLPAPGVIELLLDKARFQAYAMDAQLPVPRTVVLRDRADAERAIGRLAFPSVLKPAVKTARWQAHTPAKVFTVATPDELLQQYDRCRRWTDLLIAQEWVDGPDSSHVTCNAYFDGRSNPHLTFVSRKVRQWPLEGGVGCLSEECRNDTAVRETIRLFRDVGHHGLAYLELKADAKHQRYVIIEPNVGRPTGRSAAADNAGIDLLYTQYCDALGRPLPPAREQSYGRARWIYFRQDLQSAFQHRRRGALTSAGWLRSLRSCRRDAVFSWTDPGPFIADAWVGVRKALAAHTRSHSHPAAPPSEGFVDFDLHGIVGVRLIGGSPTEVAAVSRQIGPPRGPLLRGPDILVRFVDRLPADDLQWVELGRTGFTDDGFFVLQSGKQPARLTVPLDQVGGPCEIICQRGLRSIPLLMPIVSLTALGRGCVRLHASAFVHGATSVLVTGYAKSGKTGALLAFAAHGAELVGDDSILLAADGRMLGLPGPLDVQAWHMDQLPRLRRLMPPSRRILFDVARRIGVMRRRPTHSIDHRFPGDGLGVVLAALQRRLNASVDPLGAFTCRPDRVANCPDKVFLMVSHDAPTICVERADPGDVASRMARAIGYEQLPLISAYVAYQFAFPGRRNALIESAAAIQAERLARLLAGKEAYLVRHPYPCDLQELFQAMAPFCESCSTARAATDDSGRHFAATAIPDG